MIFNENGDILNEGKLANLFINSPFGKPFKKKIDGTNNRIAKNIENDEERKRKEFTSNRIFIYNITQEESKKMEEYMKSVYNKIYTSAKRIVSQVKSKYNPDPRLINLYKFNDAPEKDDNVQFPMIGDYSYIGDMYEDQSKYKSYNDWWRNSMKNSTWKSGFIFSLIIQLDYYKIIDEIDNMDIDFDELSKMEKEFNSKYQLIRNEIIEQLFQECKKHKYIALDTGYEEYENYIYISLNLPEFINDLRK